MPLRATGATLVRTESRFVTVVVLGAVLVGVARAATMPLYDFARYKVIVDRQPFGEPPQEAVAAVPAQPPPPPPPPFTKSLRLCGIANDGSETYVAFIDVGVNPNESYYLRVGGDGRNGITVLQADLSAGKVLLKKESEEQWLAMDESPGAGAVPSLPARLAAIAPMPSLAVAPPMVSPRVNPPLMGTITTKPATTTPSLAERIRQYREQRLRALAGGATPPAPPAPSVPPSPAITPVQPAETNITQEERVRKLREYNLELIRARGAKGPPLPIELTPDEDAQLVQEGVLPPQQ